MSREVGDLLEDDIDFGGVWESVFDECDAAGDFVVCCLEVGGLFCCCGEFVEHHFLVLDFLAGFLDFGVFGFEDKPIRRDGHRDEYE